MRRLIPRSENLMLVLMVGASLTLVTALAAGTWAWMTGEAEAAVQDTEQATIDVSARAGMVLRQISVEGRERTRAADILAAIDLPQGGPLLALDPAAARERLESLPWVKEAVVERRLPDEVFVHLTERTPIALWDLGDGAFLLVDADGVGIPSDIAPFAHLPVISGTGAPQAAADLFTLLAGEPSLSAALRAAVRVGQRRWNLWFHGVGKDGLEVRLPETGAETALARLAHLEEEDALLRRDVRVIDMRLPDRLIVRLDEDADTGPDTKPGYSGRGVPLPLRGPGRDA